MNTNSQQQQKAGAPVTRVVTRPNGNVSLGAQQSPATVAYIPPPKDSVKDVDLYRNKTDTNADLRKNAILAGVFGIAAFIHSMLIQSRMY
jgi:hypothetical protein